MDNRHLDTSRQVVTLPEAAAIFRVSLLTMRRAITNKKIKAMQISEKGRYRITFNELDNFIERSSR